MNVLDVMRIGPVIPVIVIEDLAHAVPLAKAPSRLTPRGVNPA